ncbi:esterase/lipase family protein [Streptomyces sp. NPDC058867]|uniref:esterase/lipase family protein n=1 Tax=unclassified Streptomyces TaxID=2593676 RepID=UPI003697604E
MRSLRIRIISGLTGLAAALGLGVAGSAPARAAADPVGPPQSNFLTAYGYSVLSPRAVPAGANDWNCRPSAAHPRPVILVHGTFENRYANWAGLAPELKRQGYCVFALNYGGGVGPAGGLGDIRDSAEELSAFVDRVRAATGAAKTDVVGHSQGGLMPRHYIEDLGGSTKVDKLVALSPTNHGTTLWGLGTIVQALPGGDELLSLACESCSQQITGSDFLDTLNAGGETHPDVTYTVIATKYDEVVTPYTSSYLAAAPNVSNQEIQDFCPDEFTEHLGISYNKVATRLVLNALDPARAETPDC